MFQLDPTDSFDKICGRIFSTQKGLYVFKCALCGLNCGNCEELLWHFAQTHNMNDCKSDGNLFKIDFNEFTNVISNDEIEKTSDDKVLEQIIVYETEKPNDDFQCGSNSNTASDPLHCDSNFITVPDCKKLDMFDEITTQRAFKSNQNKQNSENEKPQQAMKYEGRKYEFRECLSFTTYDTFTNDKESLDLEYDDCYRVVKRRKLTEPYVPPSKCQDGSQANKNQCDTNSIQDPVLRGMQVKCLQCSAIFTDITGFHEHIKDHSFICTICSKGFLSKQNLDEHTSSVNCKNDARPFKCPLCAFSFRRRATLYVHKNRHIVEKKFECQQCLKKFESSTRLRLHMRCHTNERPYKCHICGTTMNNVSNMRIHIIRHSKENKKYQCDDCPRAFFTPSELKLHRRAVHTTDRPYLCSDCGWSFPTHGNLTAHKKKHYSGKNFKCIICLKGFVDKSSLSSHMISHSEERQHVCKVCGAAFKQRKNLSNHFKIHENKREYICNFCGKAFNQSAALMSHIKNVHKNIL